MIPVYIFSRDGQSVTLIHQGKPYLVANDNPVYGDLIEAIKAKDWERVGNTVLATEQFTEILGAFGDVVVYNGHVTHNGKVLHGYLVQQILNAVKNGLPLEPLGRFQQNVLMNPDERAQRDLYQWCESGGLPITEDGQIVAYKIIRGDYMDEYSGTFDHHPGNVVEMSREDCDPNPNRTCSYGLHFCAAAYLPHYGSSTGRIVLVKVHPRDVVAFPVDYNLQKARCCRYEVVEEIDKETAASFFAGWQGYYEPPTPEPEERDLPPHYELRGPNFDGEWNVWVDGAHIGLYKTRAEARVAAFRDLAEDDYYEVEELADNFVVWTSEHEARGYYDTEDEAWIAAGRLVMAEDAQPKLDLPPGYRVEKDEDGDWCCYEPGADLYFSFSKDPEDAVALCNENFVESKGWTVEHTSVGVVLYTPDKTLAGHYQTEEQAWADAVKAILAQQQPHVLTDAERLDRLEEILKTSAPPGEDRAAHLERYLGLPAGADLDGLEKAVGL